MSRDLKIAATLLDIAFILQDPEGRDALISSRSMVVVGIILLLLTTGWIAYDYIDDDGSR